MHPASFFLNILKWLAYTLIALILVILIVLSTESGRGGLVAIANSFLQSETYKIKINKINTLLPFSLEIGTIQLKEKDMNWLIMEQADILFDWLTLLRKDKAKASINIERILLSRWPNESIEGPIESDPTYTLPIDLDLEVKVKDLVVDEQVGGVKIEGNLPSFELTYDSKLDQLSAKSLADIHYKESVLKMHLGLDGKINDFSVIYTVSSDSIYIEQERFEGLQVKGRINGLPWGFNLNLQASSKYRDFPILLMANIKQAEGAYIIDNLNISSEGIEFSAKGEYNLNSLGVNAHASLSLNNPPILENINELSFSGRLRSEAMFEYIQDKLDVKLKANGQDIKTNSLEAALVNIEIDLNNVLNIPNGNINSELKNLQTPVGLIEKFDFKVNAGNGSADILASLEGKQINASLAADAKFLEEEKELNIRLLSGKYEDVPFKLQQSFWILYKPNSLTISKADFSVFDNPISFQGNMKGDQLDFLLKGKLDLLLLTQFYLAGGQVVTGVPEFDVKIKGTTADPRLLGQLSMIDGNYEDPTYGTILKEISINITADEEKITIKEIRATDGEEGVLSITGGYNFSSQGISTDIFMKKLRLLYTDQLRLIIRDTNLKIIGTIQDPQLKGSVTLDELTYDIAQAFGSNIETLNVVNLPETKNNIDCKIAEENTSANFDMKFDIDLIIPPVARFYGLGLQTLWKGDLKIAKTLNSPLVTGGIALDQGSVDFLGQLIRFDRGKVTFDGQDDNIPFLQVHGEVRKAQTLIMIDIAGRANSPSFQFSSEPSLPRDEILSYLLFGRETDELSPLEAIQLARAINMYRNPKQGAGFTEMLTNNLGLDQFSLGGFGEGLLGFSFSKRLSDRVRVNIDQGLKPEDSKVEAEVDVTDSISLKAEHGLSGSSDSISVNYNWNY